METIDKLKALHMYDCLRANKATSAWGVEVGEVKTCTLSPSQGSIKVLLGAYAIYGPAMSTYRSVCPSWTVISWMWP